MSSSSSQDSAASMLCPVCPVCTGEMELVYQRFSQQVCVCKDCHVGVTIPSSALEVQKLKREGRWKPRL